MKVEQIDDFSSVVKEAIGGKSKRLQLTLFQRFGMRRRLQWIYQQGENVPGRDSIVQRFLKFMVALKEANYHGFEFLRFEIDLALERASCPDSPLLTSNPMIDAVQHLETELMKVKRLLKLT
jgi:hypothetical protein